MQKNILRFYVNENLLKNQCVIKKRKNMADKDYKINLPQTDFPMKANLPEKEPKILENWQKIGLNQKIAEQTTARPNKFILHDGPPYANGDIHLGHAYNKIFKDIVNKINFAAGYTTPYVPGWDCHGLPIELNIEKKYGKVGDKINAAEFIAACRKYATEQIESQKTDFIRLGVLGDWNNPYKTMDFKYEANIVRALAKIIDNGYLVRGHKPVHWCIACGSALAEAEVEYKDKTSPAIDIRFRFVEPQKIIANADKISIPVWTTTPWTLSANEAVALHPTLTYTLIKVAANNEYLLLLQDLLENAIQRYGITEYTVIKTYLGQELEGFILHHPFLDKQVPVILGEHVTTDTGTGAVHTAPAHGMEDYVVGQQYKLPVQNPVGADGKFLANTKHFAGKNVFVANDEVIALIKEHGNLLHHTTISHSYPHCWRHKTPLIFRATPQWFVSLEKNGKYGTLREAAKQAIEKINWLHAHGKERISSMIEMRPDWCISRQRVWGTPMTLFIDKQSGEPHPQITLLMEKVAELIEKNGLECWQQIDMQQFLTQHSNIQKYPIENYEKINDTLDVWFDSGVSHFCVLQQRDELGFPANLYLEGSDQYRGWFQSSLLTSLAVNGTAPYHNVFSHGFTVDGAGRKMSKSLGNVISPQKIIKSHGADILRLWISNSYPYDEVALSDEILKGCVDDYRKLRNTARYILGNLFDFNPQQDLIPTEEMLALDRFALYKMLELQEEINNCNSGKKSVDALFRFYAYCGKIQYAASVVLSSFYFSIIKDRLYTMPAKSHGRRSAQTALYHILQIYVRIIAPFISFTAEEIWSNMRTLFKNDNTESIFLANNYSLAIDQNTHTQPCVTDEHINIFHLYAAVSKELENLRAAKIIGSNLDAAVTLYCSDETYNLMQTFTPPATTQNPQPESELRFVLITSSVDIRHEKEKPQDAIAAENVNGLWIKVQPSPHPKCARCWHHRADVGANNEHPELCGRCVTNLTTTEGENRQFA